MNVHASGKRFRMAVLLLFFLPMTPALGQSSSCIGPESSISPTQGCQIWTAITQDGYAEAYDTHVSPDGHVVLILAETPPTLTALDAGTGAQLWTKKYAAPDPNASPNHARALSFSPDEQRVYLASTLWIGGGVPQAFVASLNASSGETDWTYTAPAGTSGKAATTTPDASTVFLVGSQHSLGPAGFDIMVHALNARTGTLLWSQSYDGHGGYWKGWAHEASFDEAYNVKSSPDGTRVFVTGSSAGPDGILDQITFALDVTTGAPIWTTRFRGPSPLTDAEGYGLEVAKDGRHVFALGSGGLRAYDATTGALAWIGAATSSCRTLYPAIYGRECTLTSSPNGAQLLAFTYDELTAYDPLTGLSTWRVRLNVGTNPQASMHAMTLSLDGTHAYTTENIGRDSYATSSSTTTGGDIETLAIDTQTGALLWRATYDRGLHRNQAAVIAVDPADEHVFVTGKTQRPGSVQDDLVTIAYPARLGIETLPPFDV